jgi:serine/threonine protein kinase/tetratricopeptide (TPR) repeat protein
MSSVEWERVKVIFDAALAVDEDEREAFVGRACSAHSQLYDTIIDLLRNHTETSVSVALSSRFTGRVFEPQDVINGRFRVIRFVGTGGMGEIYECYDEVLKSRVALKTLKPELLADARAVGRFKREIHVARGVSHHNVCRIYEFVEHLTASGACIPCLTMEFLEGETLAEKIARQRPLEPARALPIIEQIAKGLDALHAQRVLHRDLKPSNIMLCPEADGSIRVVLMDFGLAKLRDSVTDLFETSLQSQPAGAPYFIAPELLRGERPTVASDLYSFGLVVDEMVTHTRAYSAKSVQAIYYAKLWEKPIAPSERSHCVPPDWEAAIMRCIGAQPAERFASAGEFIRALGTTAEVPGRIRHTVRRIFSRPGLAAATIAAIFASAASVVLVYAPPTPLAIFNIRNTTGEPVYNYLATGLTSEILRRVTLAPGMRAVPVHSTFSIQTKSPAQFSLEGELTLQNGKPSLVVSMRDHNNSTNPMWSRRFDAQQLNNPLRIEAETLSEALRRIELAEITRGAVLFARNQEPVVAVTRGWDRVFGRGVASARSPTSNNGAFDDYMRGRQLTEQMSPDAVQNGLNLLERAVSEDPNFALAYAALANASITMLSWNYIPQQTLLANANSFAQTAVEQDPTLPEALQARALVRQTQWNWSGAKEDYLQAIRLKPTFAVARRYYAVLVTLMGDPEEGVRQSRLALGADPYDQSSLPAHALILYISGRLSEAAQALEGAPNPDSLGIRRNLGETYALLGARATGSEREKYFRQALDQAELVRRMEIRSQSGQTADTPESDRMYAHFLAMEGKWQECEPWLARAQADYRKGTISPAMLGWIYTALGRKDEAIDLLKRGVEEKDRHMILAKVYPFLDPLRSDVRFQRLITQMGL